MSDEFFYDPSVLKAVRSILVSKGFRTEADLDDGTSSVIVAALNHTSRNGHTPEDVPEAKALACHLAYTHAADEARKRARRAKSNLGPTADADESAAATQPSLDHVDQERMLAISGAALNDHQIAALSDVAAGVPRTELAAESDVSEAVVRKRLQRAREKARAALKARGYWGAGGFAALLAGSVALYVGLWPDAGRVTNGQAARELAERERRDAAQACAKKQWDDCQRALDDAASVDPAGERAEGVQALRAAIAAARRAVGASDAGADTAR